MALVVDGKKLAAEIRAEVAEAVKVLPSSPCLATVLVGEDPASQVYVRNKHRACAKVGMESIQLELPASASEAASSTPMRLMLPLKPQRSFSSSRPTGLP